MGALAFTTEGEITEKAICIAAREEAPTVETETDLRSAPPRIQLARLASEAASECEPRLKLRQLDAPEGRYQGRELLTVLTFSYGTGVFTLERIYELLSSDVLYYSFIGRDLPHPETVRKFRRRERDAITGSLERFFELAQGARAVDLPDLMIDDPWLNVLALRNPLPTCPAHRHRLAQERLNQATWVDRMMVDF